MLSRTARRAQHFVDYMRVNRNFRNPEILRKARRPPPPPFLSVVLCSCPAAAVCLGAATVRRSGPNACRCGVTARRGRRVAAASSLLQSFARLATQLVETLKVKSRGSNFPTHIFDPNGYQKEDYIGEISACACPPLSLRMVCTCATDADAARNSGLGL